MYDKRVNALSNSVHQSNEKIAKGQIFNKSTCDLQTIMGSTSNDNWMKKVYSQKQLGPSKVNISDFEDLNEKSLVQKKKLQLRCNQSIVETLSGDPF